MDVRVSAVSPSALEGRLLAGFARAAPLAEQYEREIADSAPSRPAASGTPWAGSVRADTVLALAQASYAGVGRADWRNGATPEDWAVAYRHAYVMRGHDPLAARVFVRVEEEVRRRFGVDIRALFLREAGEDRSGAAPRRKAERPGEPGAGNEQTSATATVTRTVPRPAVSSEEVRLAWGAAQLAALGFAQPAAEAVRHSRRSQALEVGRNTADPLGTDNL